MTLRRSFLKWLSLPVPLGLAALWPRTAWVRAAAPDGSLQNLAAAYAADDAEAAMRALFGDPLPPTDPSLGIDADELAEDGAVVPVTIAFGDATPPREVRGLYLFASRNPVPLIARFHFPFGLAGDFKTRVKLAETSELIVVVETPAARRQNRREIEVAIGGCLVIE